MKEAICDECKKSFPISPKQKRHGNGIVETYFTCNQCHHRYSVTVTNQPIKARIRKAAKMYEDLNLANNSDEFEEMNTKLQKYKAITTEMINKLKLQIA